MTEDLFPQVLQSTVFFTGHVQGVGFRQTALHHARGYEVTGSVRNLADGRVELVAEGEPAEVERFLAAVADGLRGFIRRTDRVDRRGPPEHTDFRIF